MQRGRNLLYNEKSIATARDCRLSHSSSYSSAWANYSPNTYASKRRNAYLGTFYLELGKDGIQWNVHLECQKISSQRTGSQLSIVSIRTARQWNMHLVSAATVSPVFRSLKHIPASPQPAPMHHHNITPLTSKCSRKKRKVHFSGSKGGPNGSS